MSRGRLVGVLIAFVIWFLFLLGVRVALAASHSLGYEPPVLRAVRTGAHTAALNVTAWPDSYQCHGANGGAHPEWVSYCPTTSWQVPANSVITVTVKQYDTGTPLHNVFFEHVRGTIGGTDVVNGKTVTGLSSDKSQIAHTLTIQSVPDSASQLFVSVPIPAVPDNAPTPLTLNGQQYAKPAVVTFKFRSGPAGKYIWHCYDPCGTGLEGNQTNFGGPMATTGYMAGTLTVSNG